MGLFRKSINQYTSNLYETARTLLQSRNAQAARAESFRQSEQQLRCQLRHTRRQIELLRGQLESAQAEIQSLYQQRDQCQQRRPQLQGDLPMPGYSYGPVMIALCLNLARRIGFRPAVAAMTIIFEEFNIDQSIPTAESIRQWACRVGVARLRQPVEKAEDWIWMVDHSNQVGQEKVLQILAIRAKDLPAPGQTLAREKLRTLAVVPGTQWKRDDMREVYQKLQQEHGGPKFLLCDGAVELRESADVLQNSGKPTIVLGDFKHFAANALERILMSNDRFKSYQSDLGRSRCQVQQTELCHFAPATTKNKARFMNLGPVLRWGQMVSYHASHPDSESRKGIAADRFNQKLGWIDGYRDDLVLWNRCQQVVQIGLRLINREGLSHGTSEKLRQAFEEEQQDQPCCTTIAGLKQTLQDFVRSNESKLAPGERTWLSTENLESSFGAFKQLEGQQSKGGFTSLVAAMPMLLHHWDRESVRKCLQQVSTKQMRQWVSEHLGPTLTSKRRVAFHEAAALSSG